ncbi:hypothetical protein BOTBODRAFT_249453 [Botryobasidium botryosum FD-172 SS1]|uniref:Major facilitator superfamily (MFS) profile domain-containing protein n=1 Tax=Botryobasidium botryosum (strain FD-172 SS1) TaxID=930990 RepID=A0A067MX57_BOTB1|nr:hypothetical protein BOTBODRAFT_249453 [Botryobasidium botryosum FD-172 SS1]
MSETKSHDSERRALLASRSRPPSYHAVDPALPDATDNRVPEPSARDVRWALAGLWSAVFLGAFDGTIVATLLAPIGSDFNKAHQASYLGTSYLLSVCCFTPLYGRLSDILGRKGAMLLALSLFTIGTVLCGVSPSMETLIVARAIAGMGGGGVMTVNSITTTDLIPLRKRGLYQGLGNILYGLGAGLGGPLGGFINDHFGWRMAFLFQIPFLVLSFILVAVKVNVKLPVQKRTAREKLMRIDWLGAFTLVSTIGTFLLAFTLKSSEGYDWSNPVIHGLLGASLASCVAFLWVETCWAVEPVMPMRLLLQRTPLAASVSNLLTSIVSYSLLYNAPLYFSAVRALSSTDSGMRLLPHSAALSCGSVFAGWYMRRTGKFWWLTICTVLLILGANIAISMWDENTPEWHFWFDIVPAGFGNASFTTSTLIAVIAAVNKEDMAVATGISFLFRTTGQVLGVSLSGAFMQAQLLRNLRQRIRGPDAEEIIRKIRHSTTIIPTLSPELRKAAVDSYALSIRTVFICQAAVAFLAFLTSLPIEECPLPGSMQEQEEQGKRRQCAAPDAESAT